MRGINFSYQPHGVIIRILTATGLILAIPLIAMQLNEEVDWRLLDFIIAGALLIGSGLAYEFGVRRLRTSVWRGIATAALLVAVLLIWVELAVGVLDSPFAGS